VFVLGGWGLLLLLLLLGHPAGSTRQVMKIWFTPQCLHSVQV
jgi:hypothetical protein